MTTVTFKAPNISCAHCIHTIKREISELAGVKRVEGNLQTKIVTIALDSPATNEQIETLMAEIGYPVEPVD